MKTVDASDIVKGYRNGTNQVMALRGVSVKVEKGSFAVIEGSSGSGKSTLLHILAGLDSPDSGRVYIEGTELTAMNKEERTIFRRKQIGFIFQSYNLIPMLSVYDNIVMPLFLDKRNVDKDYMEDVIQRLQIEHLVNRMPGQLSGGQQQRVAVARALAMKPSVIFGDEPTGNLDSDSGNEVIELLKEAVSIYGQTVLLITHDQKIAMMADKGNRIYIRDGKIGAGEK